MTALLVGCGEPGAVGGEVDHNMAGLPSSQPSTPEYTVPPFHPTGSRETNTDPLDVTVQSTARREFPPLDPAATSGRIEIDDLWVDSQGRGRFCVGDDVLGFKACPVDPDAVDPLIIQITSEMIEGGEAPDEQALTVVVDSALTELAVVDQSGEPACSITPVRFPEEVRISAFRCSLPLDGTRRLLTLHFLDASGSELVLDEQISAPVIEDLTSAGSS